MTYSGNYFLNRSQMTENAQYILDYLTAKGWTKNAVCAMLGNMETESTINPGIWQNLDEGNNSLGFGLVQWTPATKYIQWAENADLDYREMDTNLERILYEVEKGIQFYHPTMSFKEFTQSTDTPGSLTEIFLTHYERPANQYQPRRLEQADYWFENLKHKDDVTMDKDDALLLIGILQEQYRQGVSLVNMEDGTIKVIGQDDIHRLANGVRKAAGIPEE